MRSLLLLIKMITYSWYILITFNLHNPIFSKHLKVMQPQNFHFQLVKFFHAFSYRFLVAYWLEPTLSRRIWYTYIRNKENLPIHFQNPREIYNPRNREKAPRHLSSVPTQKENKHLTKAVYPGSETTREEISCTVESEKW